MNRAKKGGAENKHPSLEIWAPAANHVPRPESPGMITSVMENYDDELPDASLLFFSIFNPPCWCTSPMMAPH